MATTLKIEKLRHLCKNMSNFDEILHDDTYYTDREMLVIITYVNDNAQSNIQPTSQQIQWQIEPMELRPKP